MFLLPSRLRGSMDRLANARISAAAAQVAVHRRVDIGIGGLGLVLQKRRRRHDLACLAITALRHVVIDPRGLQRMQLAVLAGEAFDRRDLLICGGSDRNRAGANGCAVQVNGARAALSDTTTVLRADEAQMISQHPQQRRAFVEIVNDVFFAIDGETHGGSLL